MDATDNTDSQAYLQIENLRSHLPQLSDEQLKREYLNYLQWTEPIAQTLQQVEDEAQALRVVKLALEVDLSLGAKLAGAVKHEFGPQTVRLVEGLEIPQELKIILLGETRSDMAILALNQALQDEDDDIKEFAVSALANLGSDAAVSTLLQALNDYEEDDDIKEIVVYALANIGSDAAVSTLLQALNDYEEDDIIQEYATYALEDIGTEAAVSALLQRLNNEESCYQESAVISLGKIGTEAVVPALIQALKNHRSHTGEAAASALGKIGTEAVVSAADSQCFRRNGY